VRKQDGVVGIERFDTKATVVKSYGAANAFLRMKNIIGRTAKDFQSLSKIRLKKVKDEGRRGEKYLMDALNSQVRKSIWEKRT